jgi:hypothetical protein
VFWVVTQNYTVFQLRRPYSSLSTPGEQVQHLLGVFIFFCSLIPTIFVFFIYSKRQSFAPISNYGQNKLYMIIFRFLDERQEDKTMLNCTEGIAVNLIFRSFCHKCSSDMQLLLSEKRKNLLAHELGGNHLYAPNISVYYTD